MSQFTALIFHFNYSLDRCAQHTLIERENAEEEAKLEHEGAFGGFKRSLESRVKSDIVIFFISIMFSIV